MARVYDDRKMCQTVQDRYALEIQGVSGVLLESTDTAFAKDYIFISVCHDVFGSHDPLFVGGIQTAFQKDRAVYLSQMFQKIEVLHISGTDLDQIDFFIENVQMLQGKEFCYDRKSYFFFYFVQNIQPLQSKTLERVRACTRFECAASEQVCAGSFYGTGNFQYLFKGLDGAGTCDVTHVAAADLHAGYVYDGVFRVECAVGQLVRFLYVHNLVYAGINFEKLRVDGCGVTDTADNGHFCTLYDVCVQSFFLDQIFYSGYIFRAGIWF